MQGVVDQPDAGEFLDGILDPCHTLSVANMVLRHGVVPPHHSKQRGLTRQPDQISEFFLGLLQQIAVTALQ